MAFAIGIGLPTQTTHAQSDETVRVRVVTDRSGVRPGDQLVVAVVFSHANGWHTHTNDPKPPAAWPDFQAIPTEVEISPIPGLHIGNPIWPQAHTMELSLGTGGPQPYAVFSDDAVVLIPLLIGAEVTGKLSTSVRVAYQACDDKACVMPEDYTIPLEVPVLAPGAAPGPSAEPGLFASFDPRAFASISTTPPKPDPGAKPTSSTQNAGNAPAAPPFFGISRPSGLLGLALLAVLGGFILNLTPCVLPVIPIKIMTISHHAGTPGKSLYLGLWMAAGVVAFWVAVGLPVILFQSFGDPSRLFGIWWVTFGIGVLIALMSLGLLGLFQFNLPQSMYMINPKADNAWGSFLFGVMTAVLGLPCFGFVAGALLVGSASLPKATIMTIFACLGVGMALPYLVLSAKPGLMAKVPRTGPASELVKQVMGLLLLAAAAYFIGSGLIALVSEKPYLGKQLHVWTVAVLGIAAALWLILRTFQITTSAGRRALFAIVGVVIAGAGVAYAVDATGRAREAWVAAGPTDQKGLVDGAWIDFTDARFQEARAANKIVVLDFTAEWCINCKVLKATVLGKEPVKSALAQPGTVLLTVDLTSRLAPGWAKLEKLGRTGIPLLVIYTPGVDEPWLANAYTPEMVTDALKAARAARPGP